MYEVHGLTPDVLERMHINGLGIRYAGYIGGRGPYYTLDRD
jgi:hypothetical protein